SYMWVSRHAESIALRRQILETRKALLGPDHPDTRGAVGGLASAYHYAGQLEKSARLSEQLLKKLRWVYGATHTSTFDTMMGLAWTYGLMDRLQESLALMEEYFVLQKAVHGPGYRFGNDVLLFAQVCQWARKFDQADGPLREALAQSRKDKGSVGERNLLANI